MNQLALLGNTPELSALELERLGYLNSWQRGQVAEVSSSCTIDKLGGTIKLADEITTIPRSLEGITVLQKLLQDMPEGKLRFGFSVYAGDESITDAIVKHYAKKVERIGLDWKKELRATGASVRFVTSKEPALSSVIVDKEHLLDHQTDFILAIRKKDIILARTTAVQDYHTFSKNDYGRPQRDHFSGMLPPKVARMMLNISTPELYDTILDPFCGSGTVLQEALLLGYSNVIGADVSKKAIEDSQANLDWLNMASIPLHVVDVRSIDTIIASASINCIVAEGYLGAVRPNKTDKEHRRATKLYVESFTALTKILAPGARVVLAVPAWQRHTGLMTMDLTDVLHKLGYSAFHEPIVYGREHAKVVRQILFLNYKV